MRSLRFPIDAVILRYRMAASATPSRAPRPSMAISPMTIATGIKAANTSKASNTMESIKALNDTVQACQVDMQNNKDLISDFDAAIQMGLDYVHSHTDEEVAEVILNQFPDTSFNDLVSAIKRYRENDTWPTTTKYTKESFNHLQDIMIDYGELDNKVPYEKLMYSIK